MLSLLLMFGIGHASSSFNEAYLNARDRPTPGPEMPSVYQPGTAGGAWTEDEVSTTRARILQMIHPNHNVKRNMYWRYRIDGNGARITENSVMRLMFHDCIPYTDGSGGCDGCLNWGGVGTRAPYIFDFPPTGQKKDLYTITPINATDNNGLEDVVAFLELIYTTVDWPFVNQSLIVSLHQSGKSRADLWQLAGLVALERSLERSNRACDLDFNARQQVTLLESREKCEIKITKPLKFLSGRRDCVSDDAEGRGYVTSKPEAQPRLMGDGNNIIDYGRNFFGMDEVHWTALQAIHGAVHSAKIGVKYTWFGAHYISNMYFKWIANKPRYKNDAGGGVDFGGEKIYFNSVGDVDGNPVAQTGWRASCMYAWNTTEGGPCFLRPTQSQAFDAPAPEKMSAGYCVSRSGPGEDNTRVCETNTNRRCANTWCDERGIVHNSSLQGVFDEVVGPWTEDAADLQNRHSSGWNNQFALPYEVGLYWDFTTDDKNGQRAIGCPGLDAPFGTVTNPEWGLRNSNSPIWNSPAMSCNVNMYAPAGRPMHEVVDALASDNELFAEMFLEGWQMMTSNGYKTGDLVDGPHNGWLGHYSLTKQGKQEHKDDFAAYIKDSAPVTFTDPQADPFICGHHGHATTSCGYRFSSCFAQFEENGRCRGRGESDDTSYDF